MSFSLVQIVGWDELKLDDQQKLMSPGEDVGWWWTGTTGGMGNYSNLHLYIDDVWTIAGLLEGEPPTICRLPDKDALACTAAIQPIFQEEDNLYLYVKGPGAFTTAWFVNDKLWIALHDYARLVQGGWPISTEKCEEHGIVVMG